ncbi:MAG: hypothetical protein KDA44_08480 [Planctomycetales bacterium]|nr:hypothetical protein [Planctomycetales bacterium]
MPPTAAVQLHLTRFQRVLRSPGAILAVLIVAACGPIATRAAAATVEAYAGAPFGVGRVTLPIERAAGIASASDERLTIADADGRVLYPAAKDAPVRRILRNLLEIEGPRNVTIYFLFRESEPLTATVYAPRGAPVTISPQQNPAGHARLLDEWWDSYTTRWQQLDQDPQFPPVVENFIAASLARRLGKPLPEPKARLLSFGSKGPSVWDELLANERWQLAVDRQLIAGASGGAADQPLPAPMPWYELDFPETAEPVAVESMALHVPAECFYLRFGTFKNYLWFRDLSDVWQNDLGNMILRRSIRRSAADRLEQQLALHETALSKILGPQVIADVAIIGLDPQLAGGGAAGMLFQAKNSFLLDKNLTSQRREALDAFSDATETTVKIAGTDVSLIATPGGEVRSYYVKDGDYLLATTSRRLVQRFLEAGQGTGTLAASPGFLHVRSQIAAERGDAVFAYAPPEMFREMTSPATWIENQRRVRSLREAKLLQLARLQAAVEGVAITDRGDLIDAGYLPTGFGERPDGSELVEDANGVADSMRGTPGYYVPATDIETGAVTAEEAAAYRSFADRFRQECGQLPPLAAAVSREPRGAEGDETSHVELLATPLDRVKLGKAVDIIGEPSNRRMAQLPGDLINVEVVVDSLLPFAGPPSGQYQMFLGARDFSADLEVVQGKLGLPSLQNRQAVKIYWGSWPKPGLLGALGELAAAGPEPQGDARGNFVARRDDVYLGSFSPALIREVLPELTTEQVDEPAQAWFHAQQLAGTGLESVLNSFGYSRTRDTSAANSRLLNALMTQLHIPAQECQATAEQLMDGELICPLGGEYELTTTPGASPAWSSTVIAPANQFLFTKAPEDYQLPLLTWFEGVEGDALINDDMIRIRAAVDIDASALPKRAAWEMPLPAAGVNPKAEVIEAVPVE